MAVMAVVLQTQRLAGALLLPFLSPQMYVVTHSLTLNNQVMSNAQLREEVRLWRKRGRGSRRAPARRRTRRMEASMVTREYGAVGCSV